MRYPRITIGVITLGSQTVPDAIIRAQRISEWPLVYTISQTFRGMGIGHSVGRKHGTQPSACLQNGSQLCYLCGAPADSGQAGPVRPSITQLLASENRPVPHACAGNQLYGTGEKTSQTWRRARLPNPYRCRRRSRRRNPSTCFPECLQSDLGVYVRSGRHLPVVIDAFVRMLIDEIIRLKSAFTQT